MVSSELSHQVRVPDDVLSVSPLVYGARAQNGLTYRHRVLNVIPERRPQRPVNAAPDHTKVSPLTSYLRVHLLTEPGHRIGGP